MNLFSDRLVEVIHSLNVSQREFAESIKLKPSYISDLLHGRAIGFSNKALLALNKNYSVNLNWLLTGEGEMFLEKEDKHVRAKSK